MSDKIIINNDPNGAIEKPNAGEFSIQIIGNEMTVKRTATKHELCSMMNALMNSDQFFRDAFEQVAILNGLQYPVPF